jgi:hypothetical protein
LARTATPASVGVGDEVTVTIDYIVPRGFTATTELDPGPLFRDLFVTAFPPPKLVTTGEGEERHWTVTVVAGSSGPWKLPQPSMTARGPAGEITIDAPEVIVTVGTAAAPAQLPPARPLWSKAETRGPVTGPWLWLIVTVLAIFAAFLALLFWRRRAAASAVPPAETFAAECARCRGAADGKDAGARLSLALRRYCGAIWSFDGAGATTRDMAGLLRAKLTPEEHRAVMTLFEELDGLRWSADDLPANAVTSLVDRAKAWVDGVETRRAAEAAAAHEREGGRERAGATA